MSLQIPINVPNVLSLYRLFSFPIILLIALYGVEELFVILLVTNLITDILDGWIARRYNLHTEIGAFIDSTADLGTYILAILGIFLFKINDFDGHLWIFQLYLCLFVFLHLMAFWRFKKIPGYHLYSWKIGGYIQGIFFFVLFCFGFETFLYYIAMIWGILSCIEHLAVQFILKRPKTNARGLYWVIKSLKNEKL